MTNKARNVSKILNLLKIFCGARIHVDNDVVDDVMFLSVSICHVTAMAMAELNWYHDKATSSAGDIGDEIDI